MAKETVDVIKLRILRWVIILDYLNVPNVITRALIIGRQKSKRQRERELYEDAMLLALKMKEGAMSQECRWPLEVEKRKKIKSKKDPSLVLPERTQPC